jgi:hypothetical protein
MEDMAGIKEDCENASLPFEEGGKADGRVVPPSRASLA